jgi:DNA mismatch endonuclease (patch repair protein)
MELRRALYARGLRYRVDVAPVRSLRRRADIVFPRARVAVFVDGCFWHGCPEHATWPAVNADFWRQKLEGNKARDRDTNERMEIAGWKVLRFWEHESPLVAADIVERTVRSRARAT